MSDRNSAPSTDPDEPGDSVRGTGSDENTESPQVADSGHETESPQVADSVEGTDSGAAPEQRKRRRGHRRVSGGRAPDPNLAVNDPALSARPSDPDRALSGASEAMSDREHEQWLKEQRPPHWG